MDARETVREGAPGDFRRFSFSPLRLGRDNSENTYLHQTLVWGDSAFARNAAVVLGFAPGKTRVFVLDGRSPKGSRLSLAHFRSLLGVPSCKSGHCRARGESVSSSVFALGNDLGATGGGPDFAQVDSRQRTEK